MTLLSILDHPNAASWVQAIIYIVTLIVLIRQTRHQKVAIDLQTETLRQAQYLKCQADFTESMRLLLITKEHDIIYERLSSTGSKFVRWRDYTEDEKTVYSYFELIYELFERVYQIKLNGWIPQQEWEQWSQWINDIKDDPVFHDIYMDSLGMYDPRFEEYIKRIIFSPTAPNEA